MGKAGIAAATKTFLAHADSGESRFRRTRAILLLLAFFFGGCAVRKTPLPQVGAPPDYQGHCMNDHYSLNPLTGRCELNPPPVYWNPDQHIWQSYPFERVPGHPALHYGPLHTQCTFRSDCSLVQDWLDANGQPVLSPVGCWLAKARVTWIFGDRPSMCEAKR
jgi:hypothetical protein